MSSTVLDARQVVCHHGDRVILSSLDLRLAAGDRLAVVGDNGSGKSTLLSVLAGRRAPDEGVVRHHGTVAFLPQLGRLASGANGQRPVREAAAEALGVLAASRALAEAESALEHGGDPDTIGRHATALDAWLGVGGATVDADLDAAAERLGLRADLLERRLADLSSGQRLRAALLPLAARPHDLLVLDEPTNHLDAAGRAMLDALVRGHRGAIAVASHDRAFLGAHADRVLELGVRDGTWAAFTGGWDAYVRERDRAAFGAQRAYDAAISERTALVAAEAAIRARAAATQGRLRGPGRDGDKNVKEWFGARADGVAARGRIVGARADLRSLQALEAALAQWPGALVVATHDERLAERLGLTREVDLTPA